MLLDATGAALLRVEDIYHLVARLRQEAGYEVVEEKDYISQAQRLPLLPRGGDRLLIARGDVPGRYYIGGSAEPSPWDSVASLLTMKYKHDIANPERISRELKRSADELPPVI